MNSPTVTLQNSSPKSIFFAKQNVAQANAGTYKVNNGNVKETN